MSETAQTADWQFPYDDHEAEALSVLERIATALERIARAFDEAGKR